MSIKKSEFIFNKANFFKVVAIIVAVLLFLFGFLFKLGKNYGYNNYNKDSL